ncbi:HEAT repeat-containing protein 3 [Microdochium nivale]|nr:HEAT repeat-containing protein 3 [Microdochium nivale]
MGKSRRSRGNATGSARADPLAKPVKPPSDPELAALREKSILPVLRDLQSPDPKSRTTAAGAIANIIQDQRCRKLLLREQVVQIVLKETLTDTSLESRAAGWEVLRVLVAEEEADFCVHLYRVDVLTAIHHAAKKLNESVTSQSPPFTKLTKAEQSFTWIVAEALVGILGSLAGAQDEALAAIAQDQTIVSMLFNLVAANFTTTEVLNSTLACMLILSEDNKQFVEILLADSSPATAAPTRCYENLAALQRGDGMKAVLACGVLHNIFSAMGWHDQKPGRDGGCDAALVPTLSQTLEQAELLGKPDSSSPVEVLQLALEILASMGTALQQALESNAKAGDEAWEGINDDDKEDDVMQGDDINGGKPAGDAVDDDDEDDDEEEEEEGHEMNQEELEADMDLVTGVDDYPDETSGIDDLPTLRELIYNAVPRIIKICHSAKGDEDEASSAVRSYAFNALGNISWTVSCIDLADGQNAAIRAAWLPTARAIWTDAIAPVLASDTSDVELATSVTSLAWAVARTLRGETEGLLHGEQNKFISLYHASQNLPPTTAASSDKTDSAESSDGEDPFQNLGVKCVGVLGQLAQDPAPLELNREIGVFLITVVASLPETQPAAAVEALNQLFDIYGDEEKACDKEVFWKDNFLQHFEAMLPKLRAMVKKIDKRASAELRTRADEAVLNLQRFVAYKKKHHP